MKKQKPDDGIAILKHKAISPAGALQFSTDAIEQDRQNQRSFALELLKYKATPIIGAEAILHQGEQTVLFTQDFSKLESLLEQLSSGELQRELTVVCAAFLDDPELRPEFAKFGLQDFVEQHDEFVRLAGGIYRVSVLDDFYSGIYNIFGSKTETVFKKIYDNLSHIIERNRTIMSERERISGLPDEEISAYANKFSGFEQRQQGILDRAETQLYERLQPNDFYLAAIKYNWKNFLFVLGAGINKGMARTVKKKVLPGDKKAVEVLHDNLESVVKKQEELLPMLGGRLLEEADRQHINYQNALRYLRTVRDAQEKVYPYFELQIFVEAQQLASVDESDAKKLLRNLRKAYKTLESETTATADHVLLTPPEIRVGGYAKGSTDPVYIILPNPSPQFTEKLVRYGIM